MAVERIAIAVAAAVAGLVAGCARAGDPCAAHDACGAGLCHVGRCTGAAGPVVDARASRTLVAPAQLRAVDDDGDVAEGRLAASHGATRLYARFSSVPARGARAYLLLDPVPGAPAWDSPITLEVYPIEEPWSVDGPEPRLGVRAFSVTFEPGPARRMLVDVSALAPGRHGLALRSPSGGGVGARVDLDSVRLDVYQR